jgi:hypothetical protein
MIDPPALSDDRKRSFDATEWRDDYRRNGWLGVMRRIAMQEKMPDEE